MFEPVHGSAPDIAGRRTSPTRSARSGPGAMMLEHLGHPEAAAAIVARSRPCSPTARAPATSAAQARHQDVGKAIADARYERGRAEPDPRLPRCGDVETGGVRIRCAVGGSGPPLLLLHGHPQTHVTWHKMAPAPGPALHRGRARPARLRRQRQARRGGERHVTYSKRAMARDQVAVMRGARASSASPWSATTAAAASRHRMALDHPGRGRAAGGARHRADGDDVRPHRQGVRHPLFLVVLPDPARRRCPSG